MSAKPPRAVDLTCVAALSLGLNLDAYFGRLFWTLILDVLFWMCDLDVLTPGTSSTHDPDALDLRFIYIFQPQLSL